MEGLEELEELQQHGTAHIVSCPRKIERLRRHTLELKLDCDDMPINGYILSFVKYVSVTVACDVPKTNNGHCPKFPFCVSDNKLIEGQGFIRDFMETGTFVSITEVNLNGCNVSFKVMLSCTPKCFNCASLEWKFKVMTTEFPRLCFYTDLVHLPFATCYKKRKSETNESELVNYLHFCNLKSRVPSWQQCLCQNTCVVLLS